MRPIETEFIGLDLEVRRGAESWFAILNASYSRVYCAILNNQPIGFYMPAVLVKDAQRHGLRVRPIDIQVSDWACTIEHEVDGTLSLRMGLGYAKGLRRQSAEAVIATRSRDGLFRSAEDLALRVPGLNRKELTLLARVGALNKLDGIEHRRDALWQVERAGKLEGQLLRQNSDWPREASDAQPLEQMNTEERLVADYAGTGLTVGKAPDALSTPGIAVEKCALGRRASPLSGWRVRQSGGGCHCTPAARYGQGFYLPLDGR
jgi:DNA polymerase III alpha subunit